MYAYNKLQANNINPDDKPPNRKYFKPPLVPLKDLTWDADIIYKVKLCTSKDKYNETKLLDEIKSEAPTTVYNNRKLNSFTSNLGYHNFFSNKKGDLICISGI